MNENAAMNESAIGGEQKPLFTIKNGLRVLAVLGIIFVFCPSFLVSCSGQEIKVNAMTAVGGLSAYGETVVEPHPLMLITLLLPVAVTVLLFIRKYKDQMKAWIVVGCMGVDLIIWLVFRSTVKGIAEEHYCDFKTTAWFFIHMIVMLIMVILSLAVVLCKLSLDTEFPAIFSQSGTQKALSQMSASVNQMTNAVTSIAGSVAANVGSKSSKEDVIGYCAKCGKPIAYGCTFCTECGTPVPESMILEAEEARKRKAEEQTGAEKFVFCQQCGAKLNEDAAFCSSCGFKMK